MISFLFSEGTSFLEIRKYLKTLRSRPEMVFVGTAFSSLALVACFIICCCGCCRKMRRSSSRAPKVPPRDLNLLGTMPHVYQQSSPGSVLVALPFHFPPSFMYCRKIYHSTFKLSYISSAN